MPRFSLKSLFVWTALIAIEVYLLRQFMRPWSEFNAAGLVGLLLFWALYGPAVGSAAVVRSLNHDKRSDHWKLMIFIVAMIARYGVLFACFQLRPRG
jgi:hypothetical protein